MNARLIGTAVIVALVAVGCGKNEPSRDGENAVGKSETKVEQATGSGHLEEIFALAKKSAEEDFNINFYGFFTGMSRYDAEDLAAHYKLGKDEYMVNACPGMAVRRVWFSLRGVRRITRGGNTVEELAQTVANSVGDLKGYDGKWERKTVDGIVVTFSGEGLTILNRNVTWRKPIVTRVNAQKEADAQEKCIQSLIGNMVAIPGRSFKMGKFEVTQSQWSAVMGNIQANFWGDNNPVERVSWEDCKKFLEKLNALSEVKASGLTFRLPTEAEWEYACRAGSTGDYCKLADGTEITESTLGEVAWHGGNSGRETHPVGQKKPNAFGLYDMHGNVWEWCEDLYQAGDSSRVYRGGSWYDDSRACSAGNRDSNYPDDRSNSLGFRLAASQD